MDNDNPLKKDKETALDKVKAIISERQGLLSMIKDIETERVEVFANVKARENDIDIAIQKWRHSERCSSSYGQGHKNWENVAVSKVETLENPISDLEATNRDVINYYTENNWRASSNKSHVTGWEGEKFWVRQKIWLAATR